MSYVNLEADFRPYIKSNATLAVDNSELLQSAIDAAEAAINQHLQRHVAVAGAPSARVFRPSGRVVRIDDASSVTHINGAVFDAAAYRCLPRGNRDAAGGWVPFEEIEAVSGFATDAWGDVEVTAVWGWSAIPADIFHACLILARDVLANRDVSFGIAGFTEYAGVRARENPQVTNLLAPYRRVESFGIA